MKESTKKFLWSSSNWVTVYTIGYMILTLIYCLPRLIVQLVPMNQVGNIVRWLGADCTTGIPLTIFAWGLVAVCAGYAGLDRASLGVKSSMMEIGTCDMGDPAKIRKIIYLLLAVFIENLVLNFFFSKDLEILTAFKNGEKVFSTFAGLKLPMEGVSSALVSTIVMYVVGNKSIGITRNVDNTKEKQDWANEHKEETVINNMPQENIDK